MIIDQAEIQPIVLIVDEKEKIQLYDEKGDLDSWFDYFGIATSDWSEEKRVVELRKSFLNSLINDKEETIQEFNMMQGNEK